ncbi:MAG TPA: winged helix-turn-helix transcriptional regulator [Candidatus Aenigmarchaeota archaeon]|nr:winged helix-turn-helix transcriptional regulator [Candidatus Aenigmarchaeota archaeon]
MKKLMLILAFFYSLLISLNLSFAQIQYYGVETVLEKSGKSFTKLTITFAEPVKNFSFSVMGRVENFKAETIGEFIECKQEISGISLIYCDLNLSQEKRTIKLSFETKDFVKILDDKFIFYADFGLKKDIDSIFVSVKLPEGMALVNKNISERVLFPENSTILSDGRHIIVSWKLSDLRKDQPLIFQIIYEPLTPTKTFFPLSHLIILGIAIASISFLIFYFYYLRKPKELVLSVLDDFERRVLNSIIEAGGEIKQKKVVKATNLSKAKVSRVVKSLEKRGLIEVKRVGRTNLLKLVKKKFEL